LKAGSKGYLLEFKTDFYTPHDKGSHQLMRRASDKNLCQPDEKGFKKLLVLLSAIHHEYTGKQEHYQEVIKATLGVFFIELVRHRKNRKVQVKSSNPYEQERLEAFLELIETHIASHKQVAYYAEMLHLSPYQLNAITKATRDKTCSEIIDEHIILESKRYLLATSNQVSQIAYHLGYEDVSYFIRFFKKHTGSTPEAFRNNFR
jgi:AraC-like DNA-binding protein